MTQEQIVELLRERIAESGLSARKWAKREGMSQQYVSDVLRGDRAPGALIRDALGIVTEYRLKESEA